MPSNAAKARLSRASVSSNAPALRQPEIIIRRAPSSRSRRAAVDLETIKALADACEAEATRAGILHVVV